MTTSEEKAVAMKFVEAWEAYLKLPDRSLEADAEMRSAIHRGQEVILVRVGRRADPEFWV